MKGWIVRPALTKWFLVFLLIVAGSRLKAQMVLSGGGAVEGLSAQLGEPRKFILPVPEGVLAMELRTGGGTGNCDLYVKRGSEAFGSRYDDFISSEYGNEEVVRVESPAAGNWHLLLDAKEPYADVTLTSRFKVAYIGADTGRWDYASITQAFAKCGFSNMKAALLYSNLLDYVDEDSVPTDLASPCTEAVPMINEIQLTPFIFYSGGNLYFQSRVSLKVELNYPFPALNYETYDLACEVQFTADPTMTAPLALVPANTTMYGSMYPNTSYKIVTLTCPSPPIPFSFIYIGSSFRVNAKVGLKVIDRQTGHVVDSAPHPYSQSEFISFSLTNIILSGVGSLQHAAPSGAECTDPRFNWRRMQWIPYGFKGISPSIIPTNGTLGTTNSLYSTYPSIQDTKDQDMVMHVANEPLQSAGELGFLCHDMWQTIKLYSGSTSRPFHPVLDYFHLETTWSEEGKTNVNGGSRASVAAVLTGLPRREYSADPDVLSGSDAYRLASFICDNGPYDSVGDLGRLNWMAAPGLVIDSTDREVVSESLIRNAAPFFRVTRKIASVKSGSGSVYPEDPVYLWPGESVVLRAVADEGQHVTRIISEGMLYMTGFSSTPRSVSVTSGYLEGDADNTIEAEFGENLYRVKTLAGGGGTILPSGAVMVAHGGSRDFTISANPYHRLEKVVTPQETVTSGFSGPPHVHHLHSVTNDGYVAAYFGDETTTNGVPLWWFSQYSIPTQDWAMDYDGDGVPNWEEYGTRSDPRNSNSVFKVIAVKNILHQGKRKPVVSWSSPHAGWYYQVYRATNLSESNAFDKRLTNAWFGSSRCAFTDATFNATAFYKVAARDPGLPRYSALQQIQKALAEYFMMYNQYPPADSTRWEYPYQPPPAPPDGGLHYTTGLYYYLCNPAIPGFEKWSNHVSQVKSPSWIWWYSGFSPVFGSLSWTNTGYFMQGEYGSEIHYLSLPPYTDYRLW